MTGVVFFGFRINGVEYLYIYIYIYGYQTADTRMMLERLSLMLGLAAVANR